MFETRFDNNFREIACDADAVRAQLRSLRDDQLRTEERISRQDGEFLQHDLNKLLSRQADGYRLLQEWDTSYDLYQLVIAFHDERENQKGAVLTTLKQILVRFERTPDVDPFATLNIDWSDEISVFRQFFFEFRARYFFSKQKWNDAAKDLLEALKIRKEIGNARHIEHTELWLNEVLKRQ